MKKRKNSDRNLILNLIAVILFSSLIAYLVLAAAFTSGTYGGVLQLPVAHGNYSGTMVINCSNATLKNVLNATVFVNWTGGKTDGSMTLVSEANTSVGEYYNASLNISIASLNDSRWFNISCIFYNGTKAIDGNETIGGAINITIDNTAPTVERIYINNSVDFTAQRRYTGTFYLNTTVNDTTNGSGMTWGSVYFNLTLNGVQKGWIKAANLSGASFNATVITDATGTYPEGNYTIFVYANDTAGVLNKTENIIVTIDSHGPNITSWNNITNYGNYSGTLALNITAHDYLGVDTVFFNLTNSSGDLANSTGYNKALLNSSNGTYPEFTAVWITNTTAYPDGLYNITIITNDSGFGLWNTSEAYRIMIDNSAPTVTLTSLNDTRDSLAVTITTADGLGSGATTCTSNRESAVVTGKGTTQTLSEQNLGCSSTYSYVVTCIDYAGNRASQTGSFSTESCNTGGGSGGGGGGTTTGTTHIVTEQQLTEGFTEELAQNDQFKVTVDNNEHTAKVTTVTATTVTITISSTPQTATLSVGDIRKFEVTGDDFYDIQVTLNSISNNKADLTIKSIHEEITETTITEEQEKETAAQEAAAAEKAGNNAYLWIILLAVVVVAIIVLIIYKSRSRKRRHYY